MVTLGLGCRGLFILLLAYWVNVVNYGDSLTISYILFYIIIFALFSPLLFNPNTKNRQVVIYFSGGNELNSCMTARV